MLIGHQQLQKNLIRLADEEKLSHGYIFFGEAQVGKFTFATHFINYLEYKEFNSPSKLLEETLIIKKEGESIGIDEIRELKHFLYEKPIKSSYRIAVIDNANLLTDQAQNALLKITEEPPEHGLIIMIIENPETLIGTIQSRFQKIYFPRVEKKLIIESLESNYGANKENAVKIAEYSFGRPGRAIDLATNQELKNFMDKIKKHLKTRTGTKTLIEELTEDKRKIDTALSNLIAELSKNTIKNYKYIKVIINRLKSMSEYNTNKRLQLESALYQFNK